MCRKSYLVISGVIFGVVAVLHLARLIYQSPVRVGEWAAPMWPSWAGMVVAGILCLWALSLLREKCDTR
jgi:hypothetical protein